MKHLGELIEGTRTGVLQWLEAIMADLQAVGPAMAGLSPTDTALSVGRLAGVVLALVLVYRIFHRVTQARLDRAVKRIAGGTPRAKPLHGLMIAVLVLLRGGVAIGLAAGAGYLATLVAFPGGGSMSTVATLFLMAFAIAEVLRLALEIFLQPAHSAARPLPLDDQSAQAWQRQLMRLAQLGVYGVVLIAPSVALVAPGISRLVEALVMLFVVLGLLRILRTLQTPVSTWLSSAAKTRQGSVLRPVFGVIAPVWHWLVGVYIVTVAVLGVFAPAAVASWVLSASALSVGLALLAGFAGHWLSVLARARVPIPARFGDRFSMLQDRLRTWLPRLLAVGHLLLGLGVIGALLQIWGVADVARWLASDSGQAVTGALIGVISILLLALGAWLFSVSWIEDRLNPETGEGAPGAREKTLLSLFRNAIAIAIITLGGMVALSEIGINIGPLIAGAGVIGLAIGFGAQTLVQDIITGVFIQLEDAIHKDDFITVGGISGTVERLSIRSLALRDLSGTLHLVPFSSVNTVSNYTRDFGYHLGEYGVAYRENIGEVVEHLHAAYDRLCADGDISSEVTGPLEVDGVTALGDSAVNVRVRIRSTPGMQWAVGRAYNRYVKEVFDEVGIEIPFPHMTLYFGEDKQGSAPPAHIALEDRTQQET